MIAAGHPPAAVWNYSPRQLKAFHALLDRRRRRERAEFVTAISLGSRGSKRDIEGALKKWLAV